MVYTLSRLDILFVSIPQHHLLQDIFLLILHLYQFLILVYHLYINIHFL